MFKVMIYRVSNIGVFYQGYNNGMGIVSPFMPQALLDDIFSRLLALTSFISNRFIQFFGKSITHVLLIHSLYTL